MTTSESQKKAQARYDKSHREDYKFISLKINRQTEPEIVKKLEEVDNVNGYVKGLISEDIKKS